MLGTLNAPPPKGGGFGLRLKAGLVRHLADSSLTTSTTPQLPRNHCSTSSTATRHARQYPVCAGREKDQHRYAVPHPMPPEGVGFPDPLLGMLKSRHRNLAAEFLTFASRIARLSCEC